MFYLVEIEIEFAQDNFAINIKCLKNEHLLRKWFTF